MCSTRINLLPLVPLRLWPLDIKGTPKEPGVGRVQLGSVWFPWWTGIPRELGQPCVASPRARTKEKFLSSHCQPSCFVGGFRRPCKLVACVHTCVGVPSCFSRVRLFAAPWTVAHRAPLSVGFSRQEYWSWLPCPYSGDLSFPGKGLNLNLLQLLLCRLFFFFFSFYH